MTDSEVDAVQQSVAQIAQSDCFYSVWGFQDTMETFAYDSQNFIEAGTFKWWDLLVYDNIHTLGDLTVAFQ